MGRCEGRRPESLTQEAVFRDVVDVLAENVGGERIFERAMLRTATVFVLKSLGVSSTAVKGWRWPSSE